MYIELEIVFFFDFLKCILFNWLIKKKNGKKSISIGIEDKKIIF